jgi:LPS-assembly lipoprotein
MSLSRRRLVVALAAAAAAGGCGFELRQPARVSFGSIALTGFARRSPLEAELRHQLAQQVKILDSPAQADVVLQALDDLRDKSVVASSAVAEVREVQLRLRFNFRVSTAGGRELIPRAELMVSRDMSFSETAALAKAYEEADLFREMQSDVVAQVMRRLASLKV